MNALKRLTARIAIGALHPASRESSPRRFCKRQLLRLLGMAVVLTWISAASAHQVGVPLAFWGPFPKKVAQCQRVIAYSASVCGADAWRARNACLAARVNGQTCDTEATDEVIYRLRAKAQDLIDDYCSTQEITSLYFTTIFEAYTDIDLFCQRVEDFAASAVYGTLLAAGSPPAVDDAARRCVDATARAATKLLNYAFRQRRSDLDRMAVMNVSPADKLTLLRQSSDRIVRAREVLVGQVESICTADEFVRLYQRSATDVLRPIGQRGDCLGGAVYTQNSLICPLAVCGNWLVEPTEQCDDGNLTDGDGCHSDCGREF